MLPVSGSGAAVILANSVYIFSCPRRRRRSPLSRAGASSPPIQRLQLYELNTSPVAERVPDGEVEGRPFSGFPLGPDSSVVSLNYPSGGGKADSNAFEILWAVQAVEGQKNLSAYCMSNPTPLLSDSMMPSIRLAAPPERHGRRCECAPG